MDGQHKAVPVTTCLTILSRIIKRKNAYGTCVYDNINNLIIYRLKEHEHPTYTPWKVRHSLPSSYQELCPIYHHVKRLTVGDNLVWFEWQLRIIFSFTSIQSSHSSPANQRHIPVGWCLRQHFQNLISCVHYTKKTDVADDTVHISGNTDWKWYIIVIGKPQVHPCKWNWLISYWLLYHYSYRCQQWPHFMLDKLAQYPEHASDHFQIPMCSINLSTSQILQKFTAHKFFR